MACPIKIKNALISKIEDLSNGALELELSEAQAVSDNINSQFQEEVVKFDKPEDSDKLNREINVSEQLITKYYDNQVQIEEARKIPDEIEIEDKSLNKLESLLDDSQQPIFLENLNYEDEESITSNPITDNLEVNMRLLYGNSEVQPTADQILQNFINSDVPLTKAGLELLKKAQILQNKSNVKVKFIDSFEEDYVLMAYAPKSMEILISLEQLKTMSPERVIKTFLHEFAHAQTVYLTMYKKGERNDFSDDIEAILWNIPAEKRRSGSYGWTSTEEFVAELYSNKEFQDEVKQILDGSIWKQFVTLIRRLFGLQKTSEYNQLTDLILSEIHADKRNINTSYDRQKELSDRKDDLLFDKEEIEIPSLVTFDARLDDLVNRAKDNMDNALNRTKKSKNHPNKETKQRHIENLEKLVTEMNDFSELEKLKLVTSYAKSLSKIINKLKNDLDNRNLMLPTTYKKIVHYEDYLASYDLLPQIREIVNSASLNEDLTDEDLTDIQNIKDYLGEIDKEHDNLISKFNIVKREAALRLISQPRFIKQVETDHRNLLRKEYKNLKKSDPTLKESEKEYVTRMINTRDKEHLKLTQYEFAEEVINNPVHDISVLELNLYDSLNITSKLIDVVTQITSEVRDKILTQFTSKNHELDNLHKGLTKEKGNVKVSELYKNFYEQDSNGQYYLKGQYKVEFRDKYLNEFSPIMTELKDLVNKYKSEGIKRKEYILKDDYKTLVSQRDKWLKTNTKKDINSRYSNAWLPNDRYLNPVLTGIESQTMETFRQINKENIKNMSNMQGLNYTIRTNGENNLIFTRLPMITKTDLERISEGDGVGIIRDKFTDLTRIKSDDIGYEEAVSGKGDPIRHVKIHFRGQIDPKDQSLDLMTVMRMEYLNGINFREKSKEETNLKLLYDIAVNKEYLKKSAKTGLALQNRYNTRRQTVTESGQFSNESKKIKGIIETNVYDIMSYAAPKLLGTDINKVSSAISGYTASVSMTFNAASGTANVLNGVTQMFIESLGNQFINTKSLLKAESKYFLDMPNIIADLSEANKKSYTNQVLNMFDIFGGFSPEEQKYIQNTFAKKILSKETMNAFNAGGEHMMNSVLTMGILDTLKVMNADHKFIDKDGNETSEDKAASLLDMLTKDANGVIQMSPLVEYTTQNMSTKYSEGGKVHVNLLIKKKSHDLFGVYDPAFQNELYKQWYGKAIMMFKKFFIAGMQSRWKGGLTSHKAQEDLTDDEKDYNAAIKEYEEGSYTSLIRFFAQGIIPLFKGAQLSNISDYYSSLSDYEKGNIRKASAELITTLVVLPMAAAMLVGAASKQPDDDDYLWFLIYQNRRLQSELSQFRSVIESSKLIQNPVAGVKTIQNASDLLYDILTPLDFYSQNDDNFFSYLNEDNKGKNKMIKKAGKLVPLISQFDRNYQQMFNAYK